MDCGIDGLTFKEPSLVKPEFADECDLKLIVKRFLRTGQLPESRAPSNIVDATQFPGDFQTLQDRVAAATQEFERLPLDERNKYNNDPQAWLEAQLKKGGDDEPETDAQPVQPQPEDIRKDESPNPESA